MKLASLSFFFLGALMTLAQSIPVWFGTKTPREKGPWLSQGIYHATLNTTNGRLSLPTLAVAHENPGFLIHHPKKDIIYTVGSTDGQATVTAYRRNGATLEKINHQEIGDGGSAHLAVDASGSVLITAQYGGGSVAVFPLEDDGRIGARSQLIEHKGGSGVVAKRQAKPHPHYVGLSPDNRFVFVPDLGLDTTEIYKLEGGKLAHHGNGASPPGGGPRHMKFHPTGKFAYVLNELAMSVTAFAYDADAGTMSPIQTISTLPEKVEETFLSASEIRMHPSGKYVYSANRGHDSITVFSIDEASGKLTWQECEPVRGSWPRNFNLDPSGTWLVAAGRDSNTASVFKVGDEGQLVYQRISVPVPSSICVLFAP